MGLAVSDIDELRGSLDRLRAMLEAIMVRGLRACGADEMAQVKAFADELEQSGAGHVSGLLLELRSAMEKGDKGGVRTLLLTQTSVRLLERLLTLRAVGAQLAFAVAAEAGRDDANDEAEE